MAWYRTGGGGLPSSLVTDMNAVLNKKMGTSTTYPWSQWADTVNLLGKLPERTVSGAVARFDDGADGVPLKSLVANIYPTLEGASSVEVVQTGKNLVDEAASSRFNVSANYWGTNDVDILAQINDLRVGNYYISYSMKIDSFNKTSGNSFSYGVLINNSVSGYTDVRRTIPAATQGETYYFSHSLIVTDANKGKFTAFWLYNGRASSEGIDTCTYSKLQVEVGSTATDYEQYVEPTAHTISLARTVYGGSADVVTGEGEDEGGNPFTFTPVSINSLLGTNTIWNNLGNTTVTYRRDIELALANQPSLMMMASRPTIQEQPQEEEESTDESI